MKSAVAEKVLERVREVAALLLWEAEAIRVNLDEPFKLVSGNYSPVYVNCRRTISTPGLMGLYGAVARLLRGWGMIEAEVVAGGETAGIPFAAYVADALALPMVYVRKAKKDHGLANLVEGVVPEGSRVLLVEDLITDGGSKLVFIGALREVPSVVDHCLVLLDREQGGREELASHGVVLHSLTTLSAALDAGLNVGAIEESAAQEVRNYTSDPRRWHSSRGLKYNE